MDGEFAFSRENRYVREWQRLWGQYGVVADITIKP